MFTYGEKQQKNRDLDLMEESESKIIFLLLKVGSIVVYVQNSYDSFIELDQIESSDFVNSNVLGN